ncbi:hypothetical protein IFM89_016122 [Coptis chinensis]|uniref:DUF4283 domain-containing protein n=1 Tax=Coptis chinensis TaxID=261450 RepID=A0A835GXQ2_9MAGN|nr:hypothetical protein IFM89_016122 [Coptis chinensis]
MDTATTQQIGSVLLQSNGVARTPTQTRRNWSSLFQSSTSHSSDVALKQFDLQIVEGVAQVPMDIIHKGFSDWREYVVGFFLEHRLPYKVVKEFLKKKWRTKSKFEMVSDADLYYFKFHNEEDRCLVLEAGPVFIGGRCFIVIEWSPEIEN